MITITAIPRDQHRYDTAGDWIVVGGNIDIKVTDLKNDDYNFLLAIHEMIEAYLCKRVNVTDEQVTEWDKAHPGVDVEPGEVLGAPYYEQHFFATKIERQIAKRLGVKWRAYSEAVGNA